MNQFGEGEQAKICLEIMQRTGAHLELSLAKDQGLSIMVSGKLDAVMKARKDIVARLQTQVGGRPGGSVRGLLPFGWEAAGAVTELGHLPFVLFGRGDRKFVQWRGRDTGVGRGSRPQAREVTGGEPVPRSAAGRRRCRPSSGSPWPGVGLWHTPPGPKLQRPSSTSSDRHSFCGLRWKRGVSHQLQTRGLKTGSEGAAPGGPAGRSSAAPPPPASVPGGGVDKAPLGAAFCGACCCLPVGEHLTILRLSTGPGRGHFKTFVPDPLRASCPHPSSCEASPRCTFTWK